MPLERKPKFSPFSKEFYIYYKNMNENDAIKEAKSKRPCNFEYWVKKGFSEEEAKNKVLEHQKKSGKEFSKKLKINRNLRLTSTQTEYWVKKGFSEEEAKNKVCERQKTFKKDDLIKKHGEIKGLEIWINRQKKWLKSLLDSLSEEELILFNKSKSVTLEKCIKNHGIIEGEKIYNNWVEKTKFKFTYASKQSTEFFSKIVKELNLVNVYYHNPPTNKEFFLRDESDIFFYDFCLPDLKLIVEFNGEKFHPNKNILSESQWKEWKQLFSGLSADDVYNKDHYKHQLAEKSGFKFLTVWSNDENSQKIVTNFIKENYGKN